MNILLAIVFRLIVPALLHFINFARMDRSTNSHRQDAAYATYLSVLLADHRHNNPVLSVFVDTCKRIVRIKRRTDEIDAPRTVYDENAYQSPTLVQTTQATTGQSQNTRKLVKMMAVMYTMHKNNHIHDKRKYKDDL